MGLHKQIEYSNHAKNAEQDLNTNGPWYPTYAPQRSQHPADSGHHRIKRKQISYKNRIANKSNNFKDVETNQKPQKIIAMRSATVISGYGAITVSHGL